jgi:hypothetical protein
LQVLILSNYQGGIMGELISIKLVDQILELALKDEKSGILLIDNAIADAKNEKRRATSEELEQIKRKAA